MIKDSRPGFPGSEHFLDQRETSAAIIDEQSESHYALENTTHRARPQTAKVGLPGNNLRNKLMQGKGRIESAHQVKTSNFVAHKTRMSGAVSSFGPSTTVNHFGTHKEEHERYST